TYTVTVEALGCEVESDPFVLSMIPRPPTPTVAPQSGALWSTPDFGYQWFRNGTELQGATSQGLAPNSTGHYHVVTTDTNGCTSLPSNSVFYLHSSGGLDDELPVIPPYDTLSPSGNLPAAITPIEEDEPGPPSFGPDLSVRVFPIPTHDMLHVETFTLTEEKIFFTIHDAMGKEMYISPKEHVLGAYSATVDMSKWEAGFYSMELFVRGHLRHFNIMKVD
ncbi:MAG: hypothetical protein AAF570_19275, partial [Bacteroidota bacterium]